MSRAAAIALACGGTLVACAGPPVDGGPKGGASRTNVVLVSIDTLRSDRLPAYGYGGVDTPAIDRLAADGVVFERAFTHVNVTLPSHVSLFSGLLPVQHGVRDNVGYRLGKSAPTLASELGAHGYATGGFVSSYVLRSWTGIGRGFDVYDDGVQFQSARQLWELQRLGSETLSAASDWLEGIGDSPFFLFLHLYEPHAPYSPPAPFADRYDDPYDGEVAAADGVVGGLIRRLEELGFYDETLVILLSDHGEGLMDHGEMDHLIFVYREVLQVPLIVKLPGGEQAGLRVAVNAQLADVAPTIYRLLGIEGPGGLVGTSLFDLESLPEEGASRQIVSESVYPRIHFGWSDLASIVEDDLHFIDSPDPELFRFLEDPGERTNVIQEERAAARRLRAALGAVDRTLESEAEVDPETRERLESLGYLSGGAAATTGPLADPKSRIGVVADLVRATGMVDRGDLAEAESLLRAVLDSEPQLVVVWQKLGEVLERRGEPQQALEAYRSAFEASGGGAADAGVKTAEMLLRVGRVEEAREHALAVVGRSPLANAVLAQAAMIEGDSEAAAVYLEQAIADRGVDVAPLIVKTNWLNRRGRFEEALALSGEVLAELDARSDREMLGSLLLHRGTALAALARSEEAEAAYRQAIAAQPELLGAYSALAFLYALEDRSAEAGRTLREMVTFNPEPAAYVEAVRALRAMKDAASANAVVAEALRRWPEAEELRLLAGSR